MLDRLILSFRPKMGDVLVFRVRGEKVVKALLNGVPLKVERNPYEFFIEKINEGYKLSHWDVVVEDGLECIEVTLTR